MDIWTDVDRIWNSGINVFPYVVAAHLGHGSAVHMENGVLQLRETARSRITTLLAAITSCCTNASSKPSVLVSSMISKMAAISISQRGLRDFYVINS